MSGWQSRVVAAGTLHLSVRILQSAGSPLVLLHGLGASGAVWQGIGRRLSPAHTLISPDLRGHGASDKPAHGYAPRDYAADIARLIETLTPEGAAVLGHSLGALVAIELAAQRPELVDALVLVDPPLDPRRSRDEISLVARALRLPPPALEDALKRQTPGLSDLVAGSLASVFRAAADGPFDAMLSEESGHPAILARLAEQRVPALIVVADRSLDSALGREAVDRLRRLRPTAAIVEIQGARHAIHATKPAELAAVVLDFLNTRARARLIDAGSDSRV